MSDFLSNILSRHSNTENIIQPRGKSAFEKQQPFSESFSSPSEPEYARSTSNPSESNLITPPFNQASNNEIAKDIIIQNDDETRTKKVEDRSVDFSPKPFNEPEKRTNKADESIIERVKLEQETFFLKNGALSQEKELVKTKIISDPVLDKTQSKLLNHLFDEQTENLKTQRLDQQITPAGFLDRILVKPKKEIDQRISTTLKVNAQNNNNNNIVFDGGKDTSNVGQAPTIKIHIGRIDIKAVKQSDSKTAKIQKQSKPGMSLEQFLKTREGK